MAKFGIGQAVRRVEDQRFLRAPRVAIGNHNAADDLYSLCTASQNPHGVHRAVAYLACAGETRSRAKGATRASLCDDRLRSVL